MKWPRIEGMGARRWPGRRVVRARWVSLGALTIACVLPGWTSAQLAQPSRPSGLAGDEAAARGLDARAWLARVHEAARVRNYEGTLVFSDANSVTVWRVAHYADADQQYERVDALGGEALTVLRHNDVVHKLWQRTRMAEIEQRDVRASFPALPDNAEQRVLERYELRPIGVGRVAGYEADVMLLKPRDALRFGQRLWAERQTGLLLRADILAPAGNILEWSAFSEIAIGVKPRIALVTDRLRHLDGYRVLRPAVLPTSLDNEGWQLGSLPAGFRPVQCAKRTLDPAGASDAPVVVQAIYSDGLTHVSMFIEPFDARRHQAELAGPADGATQILRQRKDDQWVTAMGDVPLETLRRFVQALERKR
jgi:sigma-E factor negative regulatory protein RseB